MHQEASCRVGPYAGFTLSSSVCQVLWLIEACEKQQHPLTERECEGWFSPTSAAPGKARWANTGQSHGKLFARMKRLLRSPGIKASFTFKPVHIKDGLD